MQYSLMTDFKKLIDDYSRKLQRNLKHLEYSYNKTNKYGFSNLSENELESWESFSSRFSRVVDIFLTKYLRTLVLENDPGYTGSLRDYVNQAEKLRFIDEANTWMELRELRNITAHDYTETELSEHFENIREKTPLVLKIKDLIK